jgi:hypothetical protein
MHRRIFLRNSLSASLGAFSLLAPRAASRSLGQEKKADAPPPSFPEFAETEFEESTIRIPLYALGNETMAEPDEVVEVRAYMRLDRKPPVVNTLGYRQFEFTILDWELFGYSALYDANITFSASKADEGEDEVTQPRSICVALQKTSDYPAIIHYNAIYDIYLDTKRIVRKQPGVAMATGVTEIPPRNITVAFQKPFRSQDINLGPGTCEDMQTISRQQFIAGRETGIGIRRGELDLRDEKKKQYRDQLREHLRGRAARGGNS